MRKWTALVNLFAAVLLVGLLSCSKKNPTGPTTGNLQVSTTPSGATLTLDGQARGTTPITINGLSTGNHNAKLTSTNYYDYTDVVSIVAGQTTSKSYNLTPITGVANIASNPSGATCLLDGVSQGTTPFTLTGLSLAKHEFRVTKTNFFATWESVTVVGPDTIRRNYLMFPSGYIYNYMGHEYYNGWVTGPNYYNYMDTLRQWLYINAPTPVPESLKVEYWYNNSYQNSGITVIQPSGGQYVQSTWYVPSGYVFATGTYTDKFYWKNPGSNWFWIAEGTAYVHTKQNGPIGTMYFNISQGGGPHTANK